MEQDIIRDYAALQAILAGIAHYPAKVQTELRPTTYRELSNVQDENLRVHGCKSNIC